MSFSTRFCRTHPTHGLTLAKVVSDSTEESSGSLSPQQSAQSTPLILRTKIEKHKTELCKSYSQLGHCRYGDKCRFAHGQTELKGIPKSNENYRTRPCKGYWEENKCKYGVRCQFGHQNKDWTRVAALAGLRALLQEEEKEEKITSRLISVLDIVSSL